MKENKILQNAKKYVNKLLMPLENHYYHSYEHALEVMDRAIYLWKREWLKEDDLEVLWLAWIFHDTGFIIQYDENEEIWAKIEENYLKSILYDKEKIKLIENIILATSPNYKNPTNIYEKIIKDADMDNLWREDFLEKNNNIKKELEIIKNIKIKEPDWKHGSIQLLKEYNFITQVQKKERDDIKSKNLKIMIEELDKNNI